MKKFKNLKARLLSLSLAFAMVISLAMGMSPMNVHAAEAPGDNELSKPVSSLDVSLQVTNDGVQCLGLGSVEANYKLVYFYYPAVQEGGYEFMVGTYQSLINDGVSMRDNKINHTTEYDMIINDMPSNGEIGRYKNYNILIIASVYDYPMQSDDGSTKYYCDKMAIFDISSNGSFSNGLSGGEPTPPAGENPGDGGNGGNQGGGTETEKIGSLADKVSVVNNAAGDYTVSFNLDSNKSYVISTATAENFYRPELFDATYGPAKESVIGLANNVNVTPKSDLTEENLASHWSNPQTSDLVITGAKNGLVSSYGPITVEDGTYIVIYEVKPEDKIAYVDTDGLAPDNSGDYYIIYAAHAVFFPYGTGGNENPPTHNHSWSENWASDENSHWKTCNNGCNLTDSSAPHADDNGDNKCDTCGYEMATESATIQDLESWVSIIGDQLIITPPNDSVEYDIVSIRYEDFINYYNSYKDTPVSLDGDFNTISNYYTDETYTGVVKIPISEGQMFFVATFDRNISSGGSYAITGVHAFKCETNVPAIITQPTSSNPTFVVEYGDKATYQWYKDIATINVTDVLDTISTNWNYDGSVWIVDSSNTFTITLKEGDVWNILIADESVSDDMKAEIYCDDEFIKGVYESTHSITLTAPKDGDYTLGFWANGKITSSVKRGTAVEGQITNTFTGDISGNYACLARWGSYGLMSDSVVVTAIAKDADIIGDAPIEDVNLNNTTEELLGSNKIFTPEEKQLIEAGTAAKVWLEISETNVDALDSAVKNQIKEKAIGIMGNSINITYFEADLFKLLGDNVNNKEEITEPGVDVKILVKLPDELISSDNTVERKYSLIRTHENSNGEIEVDVISETSFDASTKELSFKTDRFSTYAIVFKDVAKNTGGTPGAGSGSGSGSGSSDSSSSSTTTTTQQLVKDDVPKTGEAADYTTLVWTSILAIGVLGLVLNRQKRRQ